MLDGGARTGRTPPGLDLKTTLKYGAAGARRRQFRQALGVSDIRKLTPQQLAQFKAGGSGLTQGAGFRGMGVGNDIPPLARVIAQKRRRKGGPAGGRPVIPEGKGGPAGGRPVVSAARRRRRISEDSVFWQPGRMGNRRGSAFPDYVQGLRQR